MNRLVPLLLAWFSANARDLPWRRTRDPYAIWISEIMLQQTQVKTVLPYWKRWVRELPTIKSVAKASPGKIHKLWEGLGYYARARNLQKAAQQIVVKHGGRFPRNFDDVLALPGIGRYTAGAICSIAFNQPTPILDGNVIRVLTRIFGISENPREKKTNAQLWELAGELVTSAAKYQTTRSSRRKEAHYEIGNSRSLLTSAATITGKYSALNQSLMELGALICTPRNPQCPVCPVKKLCIAFKENRVEALPNLGKRPPATARRFMGFIVERNGRFLVRQRPAGVVNAHLWEFPNLEIGARLFKPQIADTRKKLLRVKNLRSNIITEAARRILGVNPKQISPLCTIKHSITRYRITLEAFHVNLGGTSCPSLSKTGIWLPLAKLNSLAFAAAHKTILNRFQSPSDLVGSTRLRRVVSGVAPETIGKQRL